MTSTPPPHRPARRSNSRPPAQRIQATHADGSRFTIAGSWKRDPSYVAVLHRVDSQALALGWSRLATRGYVIDYADLYFRDEKAEYDRRARRAILARGTLKDAETWARFMTLSRAVRGNESFLPPRTTQELALDQFCREIGHETLDRIRNLALDVIIDRPDDLIHRAIQGTRTQSATFHLWNLLASGAAPAVLQELEAKGCPRFDSALATVQGLGEALRNGLAGLVRGGRIAFFARWPHDDEFQDFLTRVRRNDR